MYIGKIKYIWNRSMSMVNLIYFTLRYVGIIFALYYAGGRSLDPPKITQHFTPVSTPLGLEYLERGPVEPGLCTMRVYILHDRSRRILFIVVLGFIIEVAVSLVTMIRVSIFQANNAVNQTATIPAAFPASETIDIYVNNAVSLFYEFLLFSLALWATVRCSRCPLAANQTGARNLRVVLIEGNVMYFLALLDSPSQQFTGTGCASVSQHDSKYSIILP
ncbi:hypothetical protein V8B97DRAFT_1915453 [Scleroderma yunnanense]